ncbi:hypothetical protein PM082_007392 [Marasmius tenuissimus]|nr:hypothetical protein PM082_007392 [Marasmius tenuissimus]
MIGHRGTTNCFNVKASGPEPLRAPDDQHPGGSLAKETGIGVAPGTTSAKDGYAQTSHDKTVNK